MPGFSESEKQAIVILVRNHRSRIKLEQTEQNQLNQPSTATLRIHFLIQILRLAVLFTQGRLQPIEPNVQVSCHNKILRVSITEQSELQAKLQKEVEQQTNVGLILTINT